MRGAGHALLVFTAVCLATSCSSTRSVTPPRPPPTPSVGGIGRIADGYTGSGKRVVILGDSLTVLGWDDLYRGLDRHYALEVGAIFGEGYNPGVFSEARHLPVPILISTASKYAQSRPAVAVLALGTNDAWNHRSTPKALAAMTTIVADFHGACLVGVTLPEHSTVNGWSNGESAALNTAMRRWADQVVDWASLSTAPGMLRSDEIHTTPEGTKVRSDAIVAAVRRCTTAAH